MTDATHLREDFEALMPEPAAHRYMSHGHSSRWQLAGRAVPPDAEPLYTADQMREAIRAATERAAKLCEDEAGGAAFVGNLGAQLATERIAAAIRNGGAG